MAKYKPYPEYKDSGVEWFDVKPLSWIVTRLKLETFINMGQSPSSDDCNIEGNGLAFLQGNAEFGKINPVEKQYCPVAKKKSNVGDILFSVRAPVGAINFSDKIYGIGRGLCSIAASAKVTSPFLWWLLPTYKYQLDAIATGSTFEAVSAEQLGNLCFALPSISEQSQIATFLSHETAKIDNLIEEQQQLIELLKEKRQAVISHAVTKGLNTDVPMKDSGVEWLGEVPKNWVPIQLGKVCYQVSDGPHFSPNYVDSGVLFISARNIKINEWSLDDAKYITEKDYNEFSKRVIPEIGDVLYTKGGTTGIARTVDIEDKFQVWVHVAVLKILKDKAVPDFIAYSLNGTSCYAQSQLYTQGATNNDLGLTRLIKIWLALPPRNEQQEIVNALNSITKKYDVVTDNAMTAITILQERRTALISAAVTGKIDVRDWVSPETQEVEAPQETTA